jgi:hypothetical protein
VNASGKISLTDRAQLRDQATGEIEPMAGQQPACGIR